MAATTEPAIRMPGTPKPWMNSIMRGLLKTPGVRSLLGKGFALITVTGARTGREYSTPVQYMDLGDRYVVLSQQHRTWWRNIRTQHEVDLLVQGHTIHTLAEVPDGDDAEALLARALEAYPRVAKFYGIDLTAGPPPADTVAALARRLAVIDIVEPVA